MWLVDRLLDDIITSEWYTLSLIQLRKYEQSDASWEKNSPSSKPHHFNRPSLLTILIDSVTSKNAILQLLRSFTGEILNSSRHNLPTDLTFLTKWWAATQRERRAWRHFKPSEKQATWEEARCREIWMFCLPPYLHRLRIVFMHSSMTFSTCAALQ